MGIASESLDMALGHGKELDMDPRGCVEITVPIGMMQGSGYGSTSASSPTGSGGLPRVLDRRFACMECHRIIRTILEYGSFRYIYR